MINLVSTFRQMTRDMARTTRTVAEQPELEREINHYKAKIGKIKSVEDFMKDQRVYEFAMKAFGLKDMIYAKAYMRKALTEGIDTPKAFSMRLADTRFREFVEVFNFKQYGAATTAFERTQQGTIDRHLRNVVEEQAGQTSEGLRLALYFQRKAPFVTSVFGLLADKALYTVARNALGLPQAISSSDIDKQAALFEQRMDVEDLKNPEKLDRLLTRFVSQYQGQMGGAASSPALSLLGNAGPAMESQTLLSLQNLKRFGS